MLSERNKEIYYYCCWNIWRLTRILNKNFSIRLGYCFKHFKVTFMYLFLKPANPFLLRLQMVLALTKCRAEILSIWCLTCIWVTSWESCSVSPWRKETEQRYMWSHWGLSSPFSNRLVTWTMFQVTLKTVQAMWLSSGVIPSS